MADKQTRNDKHINPGESAVLVTSTDVASTEPVKVPGCTIAVATKAHPFDASKTLVFVVGRWADGQYAPMPHTSDGKSFTHTPAKDSGERPGRLKEFRTPVGGMWFQAAGHYTLGYSCPVPNESLDDTLAWLAQAKQAFEARIPQVNKPPKEGKTAKVRPANPTEF